MGLRMSLEFRILKMVQNEISLMRVIEVEKVEKMVIMEKMVMKVSNLRKRILVGEISKVLIWEVIKV